MLPFLLLILTTSATESAYPTAILIDESNDQNWRPYKIDRSDWVATVDSEQTTDQVNEGPISNILTGDPTKIWLTKINDNGNGRHDDRTNKNGPFKFTINLNKATTFKAFSLMPRQSGDQGKIKLYEFYAAQSESELNAKIQKGQYLSKGTIDTNEVKSTLIILPDSVTAKIVAVLSLNQHTVASCAEFNLYSDPDAITESKIIQLCFDESRDKFWKNYKIDRSGWIASANSENNPNNNDGPASYMIDGNTATHWHTSYNSGHNDRPSSTDPYIATINLGQETTFKAFSYMPRQDSATGRFQHYEFYVAQTQEQLNTKIQNKEYEAKGDIDSSLTNSTLVVFYTALTGQFVALASVNPGTHATCAEFNLYNDSPELPGYYSQVMVNEITDKSWETYKIDRSEWNATANTENGPNGNDGPASFMIDGNKDTMWHSSYNSGHNDRVYLFIATIDLGKETTFDAFSYMPRQAGDPNGKFKYYEFYSAQSQEELQNKINQAHYLAKGMIDRESTLSTFVIFEKPNTARFIALVSIPNDQYATCAEFNLYNGIPSIPFQSPPPVPVQSSCKASIDQATDTFWNPFVINRDQWSVRANSDETLVHDNGDGPVTNILDGNPNTWWHSKYNTGHDDRHTNEPFHFTIDLGKETKFNALAYRPRNGDNGRFKRFEFYTANTSEELFTKILYRNYITDNTVDSSSSLSTFIIFKEQQIARHIAVLVTDFLNSHASCAEFNLYTQPTPFNVDQSVMTNQEGLINITCDKFTYENWAENGRCVSSGSANHGSFVFTVGAKAKITFFGVKVHLLVRKENSPGIIYVRIDNTVVAIVDVKSYESEAIDTIVYTSNDLDYGEHTFEIESLSTGTVVLGSVYVDPLPKQNSYILGYSDFTQIEGEWTQDTSSTPPVFSSESESAIGSFEFYGTRFYLTGVRGNNVGNMKISIDDGDFITITESKSAEIAQNNKAIKLYDSGVIDFKLHTVKIQYTDSKISLMNLLYTWYPNTETPAPTESATESPTESATESPTESATESPTESATESPTESSTESPTESATESPTQSPTKSIVMANIISNTEITTIPQGNAMKFDCSIENGDIKIYLKLSGTFKETSSWFKVFFENNEITKIEYDPTIIYGTAHTLESFVNAVSYEKETYTLIYSTGSQSAVYDSSKVEVNLMCGESPTQIPTPETPTPLPTEINTNSSISDNTETGKNNNVMKFECLIDHGDITINLKCSACFNQDTWFKVFFKNSEISNIEYDPKEIFYNSNQNKNYTIEGFVNSITYDKESSSLSYNTGSTSIKYVQNAAINNLVCYIPTPNIEDIVFDSDNYTESIPNRNRIEKEIHKNEYSNVAVVVKKSEFTGNINDNGGAIHLINCGLKTDGNIFKECKSEKGAGGAIFIENSHYIQNDVHFINLQIIDCSAEYGGGAYIYSDSEKNIIEILGCTFKNNVATKTESNNDLCGGGAIFLNVKSSIIRKCKFTNNDVKLFNNYESISPSMILESSSSSLIISECNFKITVNMKYSIFYYGGDFASMIKIEKCHFYGKLNNNSYFIDGKLTNKNSPKMIVKSSKFSNSSKNALNHNGQFASINLKDQIFEADQFELKLNARSLMIISISAMTVVIVSIVLLVIVVKKRNNPNAYINANDEIEMSSQSADISLNSLVKPLI